MEQKEKYKRTVMSLASVSILALLTTLYGYVWYEFYRKIIIDPFERTGNWLVIAIYALLLYIFTRIYGGYRIGYLRQGDVIYSSILSMVFVNIITYLQISLIGRHLLTPLPITAMTVLDAVLIILWAIGGQKLYSILYPPRQMLMIYGSTLAESLVYKMSSRAEKYDICEAVNMEEGLPEIFSRLEKYKAVVICDVKAEYRNKILKYCFENSIRTYITPKISDIIVRGADDIDLFDTPLLLCRNRGLTFEQRVAKRALDIVVSLLAIIITSPIMLVTAIGIKLYDRGPVLFKQKRCTIGGKVFEICKFRSMIVDAEKNGEVIPAIDNDPRITPIGRIIRKTRLDELPQMFNILWGDMSLVGPRPERIEHVEKYTQEIPEFKFRLKVKGGLTGYAQVAGRYNTTAYDKLKLDLMYIENYSFLLDLKLIFMTVKIMFMKDSTEGFSK